jgi:hypothetical protein
MKTWLDQVRKENEQLKAEMSVSRSHKMTSGSKRKACEAIDETDNEQDSEGEMLSEDEQFICDGDDEDATGCDQRIATLKSDGYESESADQEYEHAIEAVSRRRRVTAKKHGSRHDVFPNKGPKLLRVPARSATSRSSTSKRKRDKELAEAAQAAEVRALRLATAEAMVQQRAKLESLEARVASFKESGFGDKVQAARDHAAVAKAREQLARAKLKAMQLATEGCFEYYEKL